MTKLEQLTKKVNALEKDFLSLNQLSAKAEGFVATPN